MPAGSVPQTRGLWRFRRIYRCCVHDRCSSVSRSKVSWVSSSVHSVAWRDMAPPSLLPSIFFLAFHLLYVGWIAKFACGMFGWDDMGQEQICYPLIRTTQVFNLISWCGVRLSPLGTSATIWSIVPAPDARWWWWWLWSSRWNDNWQGKPKYSVESCPSTTLSTTNLTWPDPGTNPGRRSRKSATSHLSYGMARLPK
jgi:hypothetical protein